ncbi:prepilin-type N-terminal cleavage/methylation domain-containing protein [Pusillimonas sp. TS35]|uniref:prepilin-type N-terminal cleavage/methylation domain-containing protein n=1 Tax=Paracandidimonas lactea TaxID=2895524 RepID=UPI00136E3E51|nr:prepilin-type N-terminal cleavage/methylation domain-containing protein [Paracandidimonas lactea]MYN11921.1 prepilin-type N-terminal cleavage/methylation domain-containing protein [Pusillimonas sp. TS35]
MHAQRGFALLELLLATMVATLIAVWGVSTLVDNMDDAGARAAARWMLAVRDAAGRYLARHGPELSLANVPAALQHEGYADWRTPTPAELKRAGLLAEGLPLTVAMGAGAHIRVVRRGLCPGHACRPNALVYSAQPFVRERGRVDERAVSQWLLEAAGAGGWVSPGASSQLRGPLFTLPNPPWPGAALPPGTVAMLADDTLRTAQVVHIGDRRDPQLQGAMTVSGDIRAGANLAVEGYVRIGARRAPGQACNVDGALALAVQPHKSLLACQGGSWTALGVAAAPGGSYSINSVTGCKTHAGQSTANVNTGTCACLPGQKAIKVGEDPPNLLQRGRISHFICVN